MCLCVVWTSHRGQGSAGQRGAASGPVAGVCASGSACALRAPPSALRGRGSGTESPPGNARETRHSLTLEHTHTHAHTRTHTFVNAMMIVFCNQKTGAACLPTEE